MNFHRRRRACVISARCHGEMSVSTDTRRNRRGELATSGVRTGNTDSLSLHRQSVTRWSNDTEYIMRVATASVASAVPDGQGNNRKKTRRYRREVRQARSKYRGEKGSNNRNEIKIRSAKPIRSTREDSFRGITMLEFFAERPGRVWKIEHEPARRIYRFAFLSATWYLHPRYARVCISRSRTTTRIARFDERIIDTSEKLSTTRKAVVRATRLRIYVRGTTNRENRAETRFVSPKRVPAEYVWRGWINNEARSIFHDNRATDYFWNVLLTNCSIRGYLFISTFTRDIREARTCTYDVR